MGANTTPTGRIDRSWTPTPAPAPVEQSKPYNPNYTAQWPTTPKKPTPLPSLEGLKSAASSSGGAKVPMPEPTEVDSGIGPLGGASIQAPAPVGLLPSVGGMLRAGLGNRTPPQDSYVLAGRKVY